MAAPRSRAPKAPATQPPDPPERESEQDEPDGADDAVAREGQGENAQADEPTGADGAEGVGGGGEEGVEPRYSVAELREGARSWLGCSPLAVAGALSGASDARFTIAEARVEVQRFLDEEVTSS